MVEKKIQDYITTLALSITPFVLYILQYIPIEYATIGSIIIGILSVYTANGRVAEAQEELMHWKYMHFVISIVMVLIPIALSYQEQILHSVPSAIAPFIAIILGFAAQYVSGKRVDNAVPVEIQEGTGQA